MHLLEVSHLAEKRVPCAPNQRVREGAGLQSGEASEGGLTPLGA